MEDRKTGVDGTDETLPAEVYSENADFVTLATRRTNAERVAGWLRDVAEVYEIGGSSKSAEHARAFANRLEREVSEDE